MDLTWTFSDDRFYGTRCIALGFSGAEGEAIEVEGQYTADVSLNPAGYTTTITITPPADFDNAAIILAMNGNDGALFAATGWTITYGGVALTVTTNKYFDVGGDFVQAHAYAFLGDVADLANNDLVITIVGPVNPNVVTAVLQLLFANGLDDAVAPTAYTGGVAETYDPSITLTIPDGTHDLIFSAGVQGLNAGTSTIAQSNSDADVTFEYVAAQEQNGQSAMRAAIWFNPCVSSFDCDCTVDQAAKTLAQLRQRLLIRTGYAAQASNPPAGVVLQYNDYLQSAQEEIYRRYKALQTKRLFAWELLQGTRYYGLYDNANCCALPLDPYQITGAWLEDENGVFTPLIQGIDPTFYTTVDQLGWPTHFQVRSCIEVFPAPDSDGYTLWVEGNTRLAPFTDDADTTTIDAEPIFLWALGTAKAHKGDRDAGIDAPGRETGYFGRAIRYVKSLVAGAHQGRRYVPGSLQLPTPPRPIMTEFED